MRECGGADFDMAQSPAGMARLGVSRRTGDVMPSAAPMPRALSGFISTSAALAAFVTAFQASARAHVLDMLVYGPVCGNPLQATTTFMLLDHCAACWVSGLSAGLFAFGATALMMRRRLPSALSLRRNALRRNP